MNYYHDFLKQSFQRTKESTLSMLGIKNPDLRRHLSEQMTEEFGSEGSFFAPPVFEHTFGWKASNYTFGELEDKYFTKEMLQVLENAKNYNFPSFLNPYEHQVKAWSALTEETPKSVVVTTGTGSGKTECFMIPIIDDLIQEYKTSNQDSLVGVRALFLYPLNALINSQQERLNEWTKDFGSAIRFCLYNGKTENFESKIRHEQAKNPNQILSRQLLRKEPAPILMTNATMLEYMLVRHIDNPILEKSKEEQSLRWIVLDEAHTYIGSQAAEISLLLRRVVQAFGKKAGDIRFVATSATIADENATLRLQQYLANLAGVPEENVVVITGSRIWPDITPKVATSTLTLEDIIQIEKDLMESSARYNALCSHPISVTLRNCIVHDDVPETLDSLVDSVSSLLLSKIKKEQQYEALQWIDVMTNTFNEKNEPFLKVRSHFFQRMLHGLWACIDPSCNCKPDYFKKWPYGFVYINQRSKCECGSPVYELGFCSDCGTPHLIAEDNNGFLKQLTPYIQDEFSLLSDNNEEDEREENVDRLNQNKRHTFFIYTNDVGNENYIKQRIDLNTSQITMIGDNCLPIYTIDQSHGECCICNHKKNKGHDFIRKAYLGAPFYIAHAAPTVLEHCPIPKKDDVGGNSPENLPGKGRKLITFTDSRQGTARMAVRMQQEAERSKLRGLVFEILRNKQREEAVNNTNSASYEELMAGYHGLLKMGQKAAAESLKQQAEQLVEKKTTYVLWNEMVSKLSGFKDISESIKDYNQYINPEFFDNANTSQNMALLLLTREFARRPKNQNSLETLGIVGVHYGGLDNVTNAPEFWKETKIQNPYSNGSERTLGIQDWKDFLKVVMDFFVRENSFIQLNDDLRNWMGSRFYPKQFIGPKSSSEEDSRIKKWPSYYNTFNQLPNNRLVKLLIEATGFDRSDSADKDLLNQWLLDAWDTLTSEKVNLLVQYQGGYSFNLNNICFYLPTEAWVCPITNRLFDKTFCGITPYIPNKKIDRDYKCQLKSLPDFSKLYPSYCSGEISSEAQIRTLVSEDENIQSLRSENLWTDISDRVVEGGFYYRTAEHSAQQSSERLERYVELFKLGKVNVLNCSTTMEMGVDIGGVSAVLMNNLPPHPANYLQRAGRAGRRSETRSIAYTLCKSDPHNQRAFDNPQWPFTTPIPAPHITLSSAEIVQRHANSLLLSIFLKQFNEEGNTENTSLNTFWFFWGENSPCTEYKNWLYLNKNLIEPNLTDLVRRTILDRLSFSAIIDNSVQKISAIEERWLNEYQRILDKMEGIPVSPFRKALEKEKNCHEKEYLLKELASKAFLPGYGFPTNVVNLNTYNITDFKHSRKNNNSYREDNIFDYREQPTRGLDIALREYAPGAQLVVDGRVYRSAGITLEQFGNKQDQHFELAWQCSNCGQQGVEERAYSISDHLVCSECNNPIDSKNRQLVLKPRGFVTDFYESPTNDINSQKFIRMEEPRVMLSGEDLSMPDFKCGTFRQGHEGKVFYHSSGEFGNGYAVCLKCGRADSMMSDGISLPKIFSVRKHKSLNQFRKDNHDKECSNEHVKYPVFLGYHIQTDVVEFYLKSPKTQLWLGVTNDEKIIAYTLAVAIRDAMADLLGIAGDEMGCTVRENKVIDGGQKRSVIQIFDNTSGGAGFVTSAVEDVNFLLKRAIEKLDCPNHCDNVCSHCLASQDSRVEMSEMDRHLALKWIVDNAFESHLSLPSIFKYYTDALFCSYGPYSVIASWIKQNTSDTENKVINVLLNDKVDSWDLLNDHTFGRWMHWIYTDKMSVRLGIPKAIYLPDHIKSQIIRLHNAGVVFFEWDINVQEKGNFLCCQMESTKECVSLLSNSEKANIPNESWLKPEGDVTWVTTKQVESVFVQPLDIDSWKRNDSTVFIPITDQLNGPLKELGLKFDLLIQEKSSSFSEKLGNIAIREIRYSDRYLKSPWTLMLLKEIIKSICGSDSPKLTIKTEIFTKKYYSSSMLFHDWIDNFCIEEAIKKTFKELSFNDVLVESLEKQMIPHGRKMTIVWEDKTESQLLFDQGMGAWDAYFNPRDKRYFDFNLSMDEQLQHMKDMERYITVTRKNTWPTYITIAE